jgi:predicted ATPase
MLETGRDLESAFAYPVCFLSLAPIADPGLVVPAIFQALGARSTSGEVDIETLADWIGDAEILLLLDNFEHLLPASNALPQLLSRNPRLKIIVTSRSMLRVSGEHVLPVSPLSLDDDCGESEAEQLFMARARAIDPAIDLSADDAAAVQTICRRLDGLPLAIELAAGQLGHRTIQGIADQTEGMLPVLTAGPRDQTERLRAMSNSLVWSYALLTPGEQALLWRLSVFRGGFTIEAMRAVTTHESDDLQGLVNANLVVGPSAGDRPRYSLLELIREFGIDLLREHGERELVREAHARYFTAFADQVERHGWIPRDPAFPALLADELSNIRETLQWSDEQEDGERMLRVVGALRSWWTAGGNRREGRKWVERAFELGAAGSPLARSTCHLAAQQIYYYLGEPHEAARHTERALETALESGDPFQIACTSMASASTASHLGDYQEALRCCERALAAAHQVEDRELGTAVAIWVPGIQGRAEHGLGLLDQAEETLSRAAAQVESFGNPHCALRVLCAWGTVAVDRGDPEVAIERYAEGVKTAISIDDELFAITNLKMAAAASALAGQFERAAIVLGAVQAMERRSSPAVARNAMDARVLEAGFAALHGAMGERELDRVMKLGEGLSLNEAVELIVETHAI